MSNIILSFSKFLKLNEAYRTMNSKDSFSSNKYKTSDLITAIENNDLDDVISILNSPYGNDLEYINFMENYDNNNALHMAVIISNPLIVKELLDKGADPNIENGNRESCLDIIASKINHLERKDIRSWLSYYISDMPTYVNTDIDDLMEIQDLLSQYGGKYMYNYGHP